MKYINAEKSMDRLLTKMDDDLKKLEIELENILSAYPRYYEKKDSTLSSALERYYSAQ